MSTSATGRVVRGADGTPWVGLTVTVTDIGVLFDDEMARQRTGPDGRFMLTYGGSGWADIFSERHLVFEVLDVSGRSLARVDLEDTAGLVLPVPDIVVRPTDVEGLQVTLGTGAAAFVSSGNAITFLVDNVQAWHHLGQAFADATSSIEFMQLDFEIPGRFQPNPVSERPVVVFDFEPPAPTDAAPRMVNAPLDVRPERVLENRARLDGVTVRILLSRWVVEPHLLLLGAGLAGPLGMVLTLLVGGVLQALGVLTTADEVTNYFGQAGLPNIKVHPAPTPIFGPTHAKLVIVDGTEAVSVSSPFLQSYFGDEAHPIDDPRRGDNDKRPIHDVSAAVRGPAVADLYEAFRLHWNTHVPGEPVAPIARPGPAAGGDAVVPLQVVRTLIGGRFAAPADGEKGVLEAYLRAIATAEHLIYLENQYFTNETIAGALVTALRTRPALQVVILVNISPDVPIYWTWQRQLVARVRAALNDEQRGRFGVFTRWLHEPPGPRTPRARIVPNYVHSKVAIVDDRWATVGSANLDGASLDFIQVLHDYQLGPPVRNTEVNLLVLPDPDGRSPAADLLQRRLWAEHLGYWKSPGVPDPDQKVLAGPPPKDWLKLWVDAANAKLGLLKSNPNAVSPGAVLTWPTANWPVDTPRAYLEALGIERADLDHLVR